MYSKFVKTVVKSPEETYPTCLERSGMGKFSIPPTSKKVGWGKFLSHLPRWDRILAERGSCGLRVGLRPGCHANTPRCNRPSNPQGWAPAAAALVGRLRDSELDSMSLNTLQQVRSGSFITRLKSRTMMARGLFADLGLSGH